MPGSFCYMASLTARGGAFTAVQNLSPEAHSRSAFLFDLPRPNLKDGETVVERGHYAIFGEIDFAIVGPTGKVLLIEQKAGHLAETPGGLTKTYPGKEKHVASQIARSADALHRPLRHACKD